MKKFSLFILVLSVTAAAFAQQSVISITTVKRIKTGNAVTSLKIYNNVEVVLTNNASDDIQLIGEKNDVENTSVKISKGELTITGIPADNFREKVVVYVPATLLTNVCIHGASTISSEIELNNDFIQVSINGPGRSTIVSKGLISLNIIADFPLETAAM